MEKSKIKENIEASKWAISIGCFITSLGLIAIVPNGISTLFWMFPFGILPLAWGLKEYFKYKDDYKAIKISEKKEKKIKPPVQKHQNQNPQSRKLQPGTYYVVRCQLAAIGPIEQSSLKEKINNYFTNVLLKESGFFDEIIWFRQYFGGKVDGPHKFIFILQPAKYNDHSFSAKKDELSKNLQKYVSAVIEEVNVSEETISSYNLDGRTLLDTVFNMKTLYIRSL